MTTLTLTIDNQRVAAQHNDTLLSVLKANDIAVNQICGGQGMCASCHFFIIDGSTALTPPTQQEQMTFQVEVHGAKAEEKVEFHQNE